MGKLTLLLVGAAILGGTALTVGSRLISSETTRDHREGQADLLARQIAESGHGVALAAMVGDMGFQDPGFSSREQDGGSYTVVYTPSAANDSVTMAVSGSFGGAHHTIRSRYQWDPMDYPAPVWLDVPFAAADADPGAEINNGPVRMDTRKYDEMRLDSLAPRADMVFDLSSAATTAGSSFIGSSAMSGSGGWPALLEDLNVTDGEDLYQAALASPAETVLPGPHTVATKQTEGGPSEVTQVTGDLTVTDELKGSGALVVEGAFVIESGAKVDWNGLIIVRAERQFLSVRLDGELKLKGALVVVQHAYPPGGHMDVTTWRDLSGLSSSNTRGDGPIAPWPAGYPWRQHKHRFDQDLGTKHVRFVSGGGAYAAHEAWTQFYDTLDELDDDEIYLEFENEQEHGYGLWKLQLDGGSLLQGSIRQGFGTFQRGSNTHQSSVFRADDLERFDVDVRSLRGLEPLFDGLDGCASRPVCMADAWDRDGSLRVRIRRADNSKIVHENVLYWHMQPSEWAAYNAQEAVWRAAIQSGSGLFGTKLDMSDKTKITYEPLPILNLVDRLGFDGNEVIHLGTEVTHITAAEARRTAAQSGVPSGQSMVCLGGRSLVVPDEQLSQLLATGAVLGACASGGAPAPSTPPIPPMPAAPPNPLDPTGGPAPVCHMGTATMVPQTEILTHVLHGDTVGGCADVIPPPTSTQDIVVCHSGVSTAVRMIEYGTHTGHGDTYGACPS